MGLAVMVTILVYLALVAVAVARGKKASKRKFSMQRLEDTQTLTQ